MTVYSISPFINRLSPIISLTAMSTVTSVTLIHSSVFAVTNECEQFPNLLLMVLDQLNDDDIYCADLLNFSSVLPYGI